MQLENDDKTSPDGGVQPDADASAQQTTEGSDEPTTYSEEEFRKAQKRRDAALAEARELKAKVAEYEKREKQKQLETMTLEEQHAATIQELEELRGEKAKQARMSREQAFVAEVAKHTQLDAGLVRGLLLAAEKDHEVDIAPEEFSAADVKSMASLIRKQAPTLFQPRKGPPSPTPGLNTGSMNDGEMPDADQKTYWVAAAKAGGSKNLRK